MISSYLYRRRNYNLLIALLVILITWHVLERTRSYPTGWLTQQPSHFDFVGESQDVDHVGKPRGFQWAKLPQQYPVKSLILVPSNPGRSKIPKIQAESFMRKDGAALKVQTDRLNAVKREMHHAWVGYRMRAWQKDEVAPISGKWKNTFGGWGATLVDAMGTLWIMGMEREFDESAGAVTQMDFSEFDGGEVNLFETTIRFLGGILSAYELSHGKYAGLLDKAVELGEMLYHAFDTPNRMPQTRWNWRAAVEGKKAQASSGVLIAELGSLTLEFTRLSQVTGDPKYYDAVHRIMQIFEEQQGSTHLKGMWPVIVNAANKDLTQHTSFTIGGMADSAYEYLPKMHQLLNGAASSYEKMYNYSLETMKANIFYRPMTPDHLDILIPGQIESDGYTETSKLHTEAQAQHLACFAGGMVGLGAKLFSSSEDLNVARRLTEGCLWAYESATNGIMPEIMHTMPCADSNSCEWDQQKWHEALVADHPDEADRSPEAVIKNRHLPPGVRRIDDARYILRPEAIESVFYLYRITGNTTYQDRAWKVFENIVKHTRTDLANAALSDCSVPNPPKDDSMESFWLAETLRYFYLIFADEDVVSLDEWVLNTEAHPLKRPD